ncbi:GNAT family N-acetyltransferase [Nocardia sp. NPDC049190]|uniref:GNAT family N-acetyltransferase n=1 Tax=Nocardia sp. NPDC049190 TaxID=3155650 RepID=UPI0033E28089
MRWTTDRVRRILADVISWRRLDEHDFPLLAQWLGQPHVARWWAHETSDEAVRRDFGPSARGAEPNQDWLAQLNGTPVGLMQRCRWDDYPQYIEEVAPILTIPNSAISLDYLVGEPTLIGHGLGTRMMRSMLDKTWHDYPDSNTAIVPVHADNVASWRMLEKAGFHRVAIGDLTPDNLTDDKRHVIYRTDRPAHSSYRTPDSTIQPR